MSAQPPLGDLETDHYSIKTLQYPLDLNAPRYGHYITFTAMEPVAPKFQTKTTPKINTGTDTLGTLEKLQNSVKSGLDYLNNSSYSQIFGDSLNQFKSYYEFALKPGSFINKDSVFLYMPDSINMNQKVIYDQINLTDLLGLIGFSAEAAARGASALDNKSLDDVISGTSFASLSTEPTIIEAAGKAFGNKGLSNYGLSKIGRAINPQTQVVFDNISLRSFQYSFTFIPKSRQEAVEVNKIIQFFRENQAPSLPNEGVHRYFVIPNQFNIQYMFLNGENQFLHKIKPCVLESVYVDYSSNQWSTHYDGSPVQIMMILKFKETEIITREKIKEGY